MHGIELRLVGKFQRARGVEGQRCPLQRRRLEADRARGFGLALDIGATGGIAGKRIGILRFELARDGELGDPAANLSSGGSIGLGIASRLVDPHGVDQMPVD